jgi:GTP-binding protein
VKLVAIVGRPNVGKSTLFNRLLGRRAAIVEDTPGVTRDRNYAEAQWDDRRFTLVDTGGFDTDPSDELVAQMGSQARFAAEEADLVLFVVDARDGLLPADAEIAQYLRQHCREALVVVNKVDAPKVHDAALEFHSLGLGEVYAVSAEHNRGIEELRSALEDRIPPGPEDEARPDEAVRVAVLGRPNVGKSSLVNRLLGAERLVVSPVAGTTRDCIDTQVQAFGKDYLLIDTAGIRRKSRIEENVERWSVGRTIHTIERAHVCLVLLDATEGLTDQDSRILHLVDKAGRGAVLCLNKWDLVEKDDKTFDRDVKEIRGKLGSFGHLPVVSISALTGLRVPKLFEAVDKVHAEWAKRIPTSAVNEFLEAAMRELQPQVTKGKRSRIYYMTQVRTAPPVFTSFSSYPEGITESYQRFLMNRLRQAFGFEGVPVTIRFRARGRGDDRD